MYCIDVCLMVVNFSRINMAGPLVYPIAPEEEQEEEQESDDEPDVSSVGYYVSSDFLYLPTLLGNIMVCLFMTGKNMADDILYRTLWWLIPKID